MEFTLAEIAEILQPSITERQLRQIIEALRIEPAGTRRTGHVGRPCHTYDYRQISRLHAAIAPWLTSQQRQDGINVVQCA